MFKSKLTLAAAAACALVGLNAPAMAGDGPVDEVRLGIYDHNSSLFASRHETSNPDINAEILFKAPSWLEWMAQPRINLGANINTGNGTSIAYTGLTWDYNFTEAWFIEGSFGGAIHNGETDKQTASKLDLGCRVMFHENASLGYRVTANSSVMLTVDHMSNASLCSPNPGLTDIGIRYGYTF
ncbi:MAG: acyloxyacyl hydrolase [Parvibaculum sp.]|uniref:acyloxyacyl hydrolase n=1 Tax=Parvibaculum sp. TaxID=2024848 RepID=UPI0026001E0B|nr:acyloxyacyl hydrolase [Parvibaculum sp.]MCE9648547.1 acyloxyacyl hydrolase [Parvibaculum sp.]